MSVIARFLAFLFDCPMQSTCRRAPSWRRPMLRPQPTPILSLTFDATLSSRASRNSFKRRHCEQSASFSRSIARSIGRPLRLQFQRRFTQNVGELSGFFPTVETGVSAPPLQQPFSIILPPCSRDFCSILYLFLLSSKETSDRQLALT
jgi:hypothetical protein